MLIVSQRGLKNALRLVLGTRQSRGEEDAQPMILGGVFKLASDIDSFSALCQ